MLRIYYVITLVLSALLISNFAYGNSEEKIREILVKGNQRIEKSTIESYAGIHVGSVFNYERKNNAIKNLCRIIFNPLI